MKYHSVSKIVEISLSFLMLWLRVFGLFFSILFFVQLTLMECFYGQLSQ